MEPMKLWLAIFTAVLAAGVAVLVIVKADQKADRVAKEWDGRASFYRVQLMVHAGEFVAAENSDAVKAEMRHELDRILPVVEELLNQAPSRATERNRLEGVYKDVRTLLAAPVARSS